MKKINLLAFVLILLGIISCGDNRNKTTQSKQDPDKKSLKCYRAVSGSDTAHLTFDTINGKIEGKLSFNFSKKQDLDGTIKGEFIGDTLFADYSYMYNGVASRNPQAFLASGNKLLQGSGELMTYLGRTYFKRPIEFREGFVFEPVKCK